MHPRQMLRELERAMPKHAMVSTDIGNICSVSNSYLRFEEPRSMLAAMSFGNCGMRFRSHAARKSRRPIVRRSPTSATARGVSAERAIDLRAREDRVTVVLFNNGQWGAEKKNHVDFYSQRYQGVELENPSWVAVAKSFGCEGILVDKLSDVGPALQQSVKNQTEGKTVLELMVTKELGDPFRRDALSKPVRHLSKYKNV